MISRAPVRQQTKVAVTPLVADVLFIQTVDCTRAEIPAYGTAHPDTERWPHHKFVYYEDAKASSNRDEVYDFYYAADRDDQDLYNSEHSQADIGGTKFDTISRSYVILRADYDPAEPAQGSTGPDDNHVLAERQQKRIGQKELDSLYVAESRTYIKKTTLTNITVSQETGIVSYEKTTLYYRGETVGGYAIENLVDDTDSLFWAVQESGYARRGQQLTDNWFAVIEFESVDITPTGDWVSDHLWPDKFFCPNNTESTTTVSVSSGSIPQPTADEKQKLVNKKRGNVLIEQVLEQIGTPATLRSSSIDERTGEAFLETQEVVPAEDAEDTTVDEDGMLTIYSPIDGCLSLKVQRKIVSATEKTWTQLTNYEWPPVLEYINLKSWPRRDGRLDKVFADVRFKEGYSGPQKMTVRQWWQSEPYEVEPPIPMLSVGFAYESPLFSIRIPPCLHGVVSFTTSIGTDDPTYTTAYEEWSTPATNLTDWPDSVQWVESKPHAGGYQVTEYTILKPVVP